MTDINNRRWYKASADNTIACLRARRGGFARIARLGLLGAALVLSLLGQGTAAAGDHNEGRFIPRLLMTSTVPASGDLNPYGVAFVPPHFPAGGPLHPGDILVSNFNDSTNTQGTGTSIIQFTPDDKIAPPKQATVFFQGTFPGLTMALGILQRGFVLVGAVTNKNGTATAGPLLILDRNGNVISSITKGLNGPWGLTIVDGFDHAKVFVSNVLDGTVALLDLDVDATTVKVKSFTQIASGYTHRPDPNAFVVGPAGLAYDSSDGSLFVASTADNAIYKVLNAGSMTQALTGKGKIVFQDNHLRGPLALVFAPNGDLLTSNGDAVNADPTQPSEIVEFRKKGEFIGQFNVDQAEGGAFGIAVNKSDDNSVRLAAVDDNANDLIVDTFKSEK